MQIIMYQYFLYHVIIITCTIIFLEQNLYKLQTKSARLLFQLNNVVQNAL